MRLFVFCFVIALTTACLAVAALSLAEGFGKGNAETAAGRKLEVGSPAPSFSLPGSDGKTYALDDFRDSKVIVVAWFPKAFTGG